MDEYINFMIKVFSIKDIIRKAIITAIVLIIVFGVSNLILNSHVNKEKRVINKAMTGMVKDEIGLTGDSKKEDKVKKMGKVIMNSEFEIIEGIKQTEENKENTQDNQLNDINSEVINEQPKEEIKTEEKVKTEEIPNEVQPRYNTEYESVKINNSTEYDLTEEMLNPNSVTINKGKAIIYHTHTCESYTPTEELNYDMSGNYRTTDLEFSVAKVGDELKKQLELYNWSIIHNQTCHDYPSYNGSYSRSLNTVRNIINESGESDIIIDLHRDAIADSSYAPKVKIGEEIVSQLMFVIGTDITIPEHKNWNQNLKFAIKVQEKANELYPGLFKPIILRNSAYNQYLSKGACIIEVGATGNTLEESIGAMKYLAKILNEL